MTFTTVAFPLLRQSQQSAMATAHHRQNESYPLQLKIRSHETPATTDLSEPLMNQALYLFFSPNPTVQVQSLILATPNCCPTGSVWKNNQSITMLLCSSLASPSLGPNCHIHPEADTLLPPAPKSNPYQKYGCSWWNQPHLKNMIVKWDHSPPGEGENQKYLKPPPRVHY